MRNYSLVTLVLLVARRSVFVSSSGVIDTLNIQIWNLKAFGSDFSPLKLKVDKVFTLSCFTFSWICLHLLLKLSLSLIIITFPLLSYSFELRRHSNLALILPRHPLGHIVQPGILIENSCWHLTIRTTRLKIIITRCNLHPNSQKRFLISKWTW